MLLATEGEEVHCQRYCQNCIPLTVVCSKQASSWGAHGKQLGIFRTHDLLFDSLYFGMCILGTFIYFEPSYYLTKVHLCYKDNVWDALGRLDGVLPFWKAYTNCFL